MKCEKDVMSGSNSPFIDYPMVATENETDGSQKVPHGANAKSTRKESLKSAIRMQGQMVRQNSGKKGKTYFVKFAETTENVNKFEILDASGQAQKVITDTRNTQGLTRSKRQIKTPKRLLDSDAFVQLKPSSKTSKNIKQTNPEPDIKTLQLPYITICELSKNDLFVEIEVEPEFQLSPIEFIEEVNGRLKYGLSLSKEKNIVKDELGESTMEHNEQKPDIGGNEQKQDGEEKEKRPKRKKKKKTAKQVDDLKDIPVQQINNSNNISNETVNDTDETMKELQENETPCLEPISDVTDEQTQTVQEDDGDNEDADYDPTEEEEVEKTKPQKERKLKEETKPKRKYTKRKAYNQDNTHYTVVTNEEGQKVFACKICGKECKSATNVIDHLYRHTNCRPNICQFCDMAFKSIKALKRHEVRHQEKSIICDTCGALFYSRSDLKSHFDTHTNERKYICKDCGKGFNHSSTLARHRQIHRQNRSKFQCHVCGTTFQRTDGVKRHMQNIHNIRDKTKDMVGNKTHTKKRETKKKRNASESQGGCSVIGNQTSQSLSHNGNSTECSSTRTFQDRVSDNSLVQDYQMRNGASANHYFTSISELVPSFSGQTTVTVHQTPQDLCQLTLYQTVPNFNNSNEETL